MILFNSKMQPVLKSMFIIQSLMFPFKHAIMMKTTKQANTEGMRNETEPNHVSLT